MVSRLRINASQTSEINFQDVSTVYKHRTSRVSVIKLLRVFSWSWNNQLTRTADEQIDSFNFVNDWMKIEIFMRKTE